MTDGFSSSPLFGGLATWLLDQGQREATVTDIVQGMGRRLLGGGVPISRLSVGGMMLHPVFGAMDVVWEADNDQIRHGLVPREAITSEEFRNAPFFHMAADKVPFLRQRLDQGPAEREYPIFDRLRASGFTDYFAFYRSYGRTKEVKWADLPPGMEGTLGSYSTRRIGGFEDHEIENLKALTLPLALAIKSTTTYDLANALLDAYLGRYSGGHVLEGLVERGDGRIIDCVLWYCDLRSSTAMADELPVEDYLRTLDEYFDCTAGAVLDHGGEVLKFIGDAVMAIFPVEADTRPRVDMCRAAMMTAREAISRVERRNSDRVGEGAPAIRFGTSLHVGEVMYGNVGTRKRLDFTVIGPAVNEAVRLEGLCKTLGAPITVSSSFKDVFPGELVSLGVHEIAGRKEGLEVYTLPEFADSAGQAAENVAALRPKPV